MKVHKKKNKNLIKRAKNDSLEPEMFKRIYYLFMRWELLIHFLNIILIYSELVTKFPRVLNTNSVEMHVFKAINENGSFHVPELCQHYHL